jgi:hypothetical protein
MIYATIENIKPFIRILLAVTLLTGAMEMRRASCFFDIAEALQS